MQVVASFIVTAALTILASGLFALVRRYDESEYPDNVIDRWIHKNVAEQLQRWKLRSRTPEEFLKGVVVGLSDQQLVTGLSILITACFMYASHRIEVYHFQIVMDLAWFSANTHMMSLLLTLDYFAEDRPESRPRPVSRRWAFRRTAADHHRGHRAILTLTAWRLLCIYVTVALLLWGEIITTYYDMSDWANCPMNCLPLDEPGGSPLTWGIIDSALILWVYGFTIPYACLTDKLRSRLRDLGNAVCIQFGRLVSILRVPSAIQAVFKAGLSMVWAILSSTISEVAIQLVWFCLGLWVILGDLSWGRDFMSAKEQQDEREWGFGQVVPIILLMLPFMTMVETYVGKLDP